MAQAWSWLITPLLCCYPCSFISSHLRPPFPPCLSSTHPLVRLCFTPSLYFCSSLIQMHLSSVGILRFQPPQCQTHTDFYSHWSSGSGASSQVRDRSTSGSDGCSCSFHSRSIVSAKQKTKRHLSTRHKRNTVDPHSKNSAGHRQFRLILHLKALFPCHHYISPSLSLLRSLSLFFITI